MSQNLIPAMLQSSECWASIKVRIYACLVCTFCKCLQIGHLYAQDEKIIFSYSQTGSKYCYLYLILKCIRQRSNTYCLPFPGSTTLWISTFQNFIYQITRALVQVVSQNAQSTPMNNCIFLFPRLMLFSAKFSLQPICFSFFFFLGPPFCNSKMSLLFSFPFLLLRWKYMQYTQAMFSYQGPTAPKASGKYSTSRDYKCINLSSYVQSSPVILADE